MAEYCLEIISAASRAREAAEKDLAALWQMEDVLALEDAGLMHSRKLTKREVENNEAPAGYEPGERLWEWTVEGLALYRALDGENEEPKP